jgi:hypothetical protein
MWWKLKSFCASSSSLVVQTPPSPAVSVLPICSEKQPISPIEPQPCPFHWSRARARSPR